MFGWQNNPALSRTNRGEWKRLNSEKRNYTVQNLFNTKLACYVVLQLIIYFLVLLFAISVHIRGLLLPSAVAQIAMHMPRTTSYVITLIATVISFLNTLLLGLVLQAALTARMNRPMSLQTLRGSLSLIAGQKLLGLRGLKIFWAWIKSLACLRDGRKHLAPSDREYWTWVKYTLMYTVLCGSLTSSWTSFLTPTLVELEFPFSGEEVDYLAAAKSYITPYPDEGSPLFAYMNATRGMNGYGLNYVTMFLQAGDGAVASNLSSPYYIPFQGSSYYGSTGGVYTNISMVMRDANQSIPMAYEGWPQNYTMLYQGFSAEVNCRQQEFIDAVGVYPSATLYRSVSSGNSFIASNQIVAADYDIEKWLMVTNCSSNSVAYTNDILALAYSNDYILGDGLLMGSVCKYQDFEKATNQSFLVLVQGYGDYNFTTPTICEVSPLITSVNVTFDGYYVDVINVVKSEPLSPDGQQPGYIDRVSDLIWLMMFDGQSPSGNSMMAGIQTVVYGVENTATLFNGTWLNYALENYLTGSIEFFGTNWRYNVQQDPNPPMRPYSGSVYVQSLGYQYHRSSYLLLIAPLTIVVIFTCCAAVYTPVTQPKRPCDVRLIEDEMTEEMMGGPLSSMGRSEDFDPTNAIHLMMVAPRTLLAREVQESELLQIRLDSIQPNIAETHSLRTAQPQLEDDKEKLLERSSYV